LPLLPAFYTYCARVGLRLLLGEARYARLRRGVMGDEPDAGPSGQARG
jgi:hypothetical protein